MGGMIGAVSTKIAIQAGMLLLSARVDKHPVQAILDPSASHTHIAADLARRLQAEDGPDDADRAIGGHHFIGVDHHAVRLHTVRVGATMGSAPVTIGNDLLRESPLELDFAHHHLHLLEHRDVVRASRGLVRVPLAVAPSGCLELSATRTEGTPVIAALVPGGEPEDEMVSVRLGSVALQASTPAAGAHACSAGFVALGWHAFGLTRVIIDLPGNALWITPAG